MRESLGIDRLIIGMNIIYKNDSQVNYFSTLDIYCCETGRGGRRKGVIQFAFENRKKVKCYIGLCRKQF